AGQATYYGDGSISGGMCSFTTYTLPSGIFGTALSDSNWDTAGNCGACISVTGPSGNSIKAMIVDQCPGCGLNHLDLFPDAFSALANPTKGVIDVSWTVVPCDITSPISLHNKDGVSAYWFSMQVVNANVPVESLEVSTDSSVTWQATERQDYNFFQQASGFGTTSVDVRITSTTGEKIIVKGVQIASGASTEASSNFSA
ncbi:rare lipo protein A, partial [Lophium mytilinum]